MNTRFINGPLSTRGVGTAAMIIIALVCALLASVAGLVLSGLLLGDLSIGGGGEHQRDGDNAEHAFISFDPVVVNLAEGRLTRYLKVALSLKVERRHAERIDALVNEQRSAVFKNWLITYLSDLQLEDVKGAVSINRARREILAGFNAILDDLEDLYIEDVLFEEFNIQ